MLFRRINFFGGPGCGKSSASAYLFNKLKVDGYNVELIQEVAKEWAYEKREINAWDQLNLFSSQTAREYRVLSSNENIIIICDSPSVLAIPYANKYGFRFCEQLVEISKGFELDYPSINFYLERDDCPFNQEGRYENYEESKYMDIKIKNFLNENDISYIPTSYKELDYILNTTKSFLSS